MIEYGSKTMIRAQRAILCTPFKLAMFTQMISQSISIYNIVGTQGVELGYSDRPLLELITDSHLNWLILVGVLRREVDGQGITDSFRLTPLGRQLVTNYQPMGKFPQPSWWDKINNWLSRWFGL